MVNRRGYRALDDLAGIGPVHQVQPGYMPCLWRLTLHHDHQHLVCEECDRTIAVPLDFFQWTYDLLRRSCDFSPNHHNLEILGYRQECPPKRELRPRITALNHGALP